MYMPLAIDIKKALIFGGERGEGLQKTQKLSLFADQILVIPESEGLKEIILPQGLQSEVKEKLFLPDDRSIPLHSVSAGRADLETLLTPQQGLFVVSDLSDLDLNKKISKICQSRGILCNIIDNKELSGVWFMSLIQTEHLNIAISTRGGAAYYSARLREELQPMIEEKDRVAGILTQVRQSLEPGDLRFKILDRIYKDKDFQKHIRRQRWKKAQKRAFKIREGL